MKFVKKTKKITRDVDVYVAKDTYDKLEKYYIAVFNSDIFKCNTQEEFELVKYYFEHECGYRFDTQFEYTEAKYPIYCLYSDWEVYNINEKLYEGLIEFIKEKK